jgi:mono/diheme cytochrome c family protein
MIRACIVTAAVFLAACAAPPVNTEAVSGVSQQDQIADGREIAENQCASCHAVGESGESPNPHAPKFRTVLSRYHAEVLQQELMEGIQVAHPMPDFQMNPVGVDALIAYLQSIQKSE